METLNKSKNILDISRDLLLSLKTKKNYQDSLLKLKSTSYDMLKKELYNDDKKKVFWINTYNSFIIISFKDQILSKLYPKTSYFSRKLIEIGELRLSFDDVEHKILRKSQIKYGLGYFSRWFVPKWEKELRIQNRDYRVHFGLNCGANSCPPIAVYHEQKINDQLNLAQTSFIKSESNFEKNILKTSKIFYWFKGDFHGNLGIIDIHKNMKIIPSEENRIKIIYRNYDWSVREKYME